MNLPMQSKLTVPLIQGIIGTIGFNLAPIALGYGMAMNVCFVLYAGIMLFLASADRRVLGYATVLSACNLANNQANLSFSFLLAILTIFKEYAALGQVIWKLGKYRWWSLYLAAFLLVAVSVPSWSSDPRTMATEVKQAMSCLGYLVAFPLAVGLTIRTSQDGVRAVSLLCLVSVALLAVFYYQGQAGVVVISAVQGDDGIGVEQFIGNISLNFLRTAVCIPLAALAAGALALGVGIGCKLRAVPLYLASCASTFMLMMLASIGSALAMVCGMGVVALGYSSIRLSPGRILFAAILVSAVGSTLYWVAFETETENPLSARAEEKRKQMETIGIDRQVLWEEGIAEICKTPAGRGWACDVGHSDWLLFWLAYGWPTGLLYIIAAGSLFSSMLGSLRRPRIAADRPSSTLLLVGLATLSVFVINAVLDMLSPYIGYYGIVWALILTPATVVAITDTATRATKNVSVRPILPSRQRHHRGLTIPDWHDCRTPKAPAMIGRT